jgi:glutamate synthase (NADPH/NADH) small chain
LGKATGFLEYGREAPRRRPVAERVRDYREIYHPLGDDTLHRQAARCMDCGVPFCHGASPAAGQATAAWSLGCPLGNVILEFNDLVYRRRWREALQVLHSTNNFPEFTGRICPAPCEWSCVLGINEEPVAIREIEKAIVERGFKEGWVVPEPPMTRTGKHVAVVGSGPAGLAAAQQLNRAGHRVTVYERADRIGGLLRYGIPDFKLEKRHLDRRLQIIAEEGVRFETNIKVGRDLPVAELREFDAVCLAGGATEPRDLPVPGRQLKGIHFAMDYLRQQNRRVAGDAIPAGEEIVAEGKRVVIIGGGDTGADCLGTAHRQGARQVRQFELLPQPPPRRTERMPWPTYPAVLRTETSHEEGGERRWCVSTKALTGNGCVQRLHAVNVDFNTGAMKEVPGTEFEIEVDLVLLALGFVHPEHEPLLSGLGVELDARGNAAVGGDMMTTVPGVFAAGDLERGQSLVVWAIAGGRRAAHFIDRYLMGRTNLPQ